jgi:hypothetical protein
MMQEWADYIDTLRNKNILKKVNALDSVDIGMSTD